ncbi:MAG: histidinol-phosphate aminotransferase family protein [Candidatus Caldatribacterium sp.]|nr:histidinol-phosphate aminotransferase family protein [Candidatus Caldatribacterium sp.]MDW8081146.1 aminotransferase class I/II-fold pyridoxal phosphate-dependent enzyme [Candidatus Calescibacterium sp.]
MTKVPHGGRTIERLKVGKRGLDLSANCNPLGPPDVLQRRWGELFSYVALYPPLDPLFASQYIGRMYNLPEATILPCNGATQGIYLLARCLPGKTVALVEPSFGEYRVAFTLAGKLVISWSVFPKRSLGDPKEVDVVVFGNPGNPLGDTEALDLYFSARRRKLSTIFVVDEAFQEFMGEATSLTGMVFEDRNLYVVRSLTKYFALPGLRGGFLVAHPENILRLAEYLEPWSVNAILIRALEILAEEDLTPFREATELWLREEKAFLEEAFRAFPFLSFYPSWVNFYTLWVTGNGNGRELLSFLEERGIFVRSLADFVGLDERFFRIAVRTREENLRFLEVVEEYGRRTGAHPWGSPKR